MAEPDAPADVAAKSAAVKSTPPPTSKPAKSGAGARKVRAPAPEVTVTLTGTADGEWSVEVMNGKKRPVRGLPVASSAVAQAAKILHPEVADVVAAVLETVRGAQQAKVQQLQAELAEAERLLAELGD
ncbi:DUF6319 family protein [Nocardia sp. CNY236]|uniref:DUF6319 family protein n=1 Tax=Nocardia sp. CNY236 TaxID=1169152 RepID=UPI001E55D730|nr:DUF6319 family protein [Nocardia sp. CNY236]